MTISKLYSNKPDIFAPIEFAGDLNVVLAEIRLPENKNRDTHNLGKTTLGRMLDFGFLAGRDPKFFLFKHLNLFEEFVFFLEIQIGNENYVTVRRSVAEASRIYFKKHSAQYQDFSDLADDDWDHADVPFQRARDLLDSLLNWNGLKPWQFRKGLGYFLRSQADFGDVFHLGKFKNAHADWKPYLAHILGFNAEVIADHYAKEAELEDKENKVTTIRQELGGEIADASKIDGILLLKQEEVDKKQKLLDDFDFRSQDKLESKQLVEQVDERIAALNERRYSLNQNRKKVIASLEEDQILFDPENADNLFREAGLLFEGQIKKDFKQLIAFNRAITDERQGYLAEERATIESELKKINTELNTLGKRRVEMLSFLSSDSSFTKYKHVSNELVTLRADVESLERQREFIYRLQELRSDIRKLIDEKTQLRSQIEADVETQSAEKDSQFSTIRLYFNEIVEEVVGSKALLSVRVNQYGHLDFAADFLDESGNETSAGRGTSYKKLLCIAFDLAVLRAHLDEPFPRFVYHDGIFETLDDRKKQNLLGILRRYTAMGIQSIITLIDSDLPPEEDSRPVFDSEEIVLLLHDENESGRLFKMNGW